MKIIIELEDGEIETAQVIMDRINGIRNTPSHVVSNAPIEFNITIDQAVGVVNEVVAYGARNVGQVE